MKIIDGKQLQKEILANIKEEVATLSFKPVFCDVLVGEDPASLQYVRMKAKMAESVGMSFHNANFPGTITTPDLVKEVKLLNKIPNMCGIIVQLPLPESIDRREVLDAIDSHLDVDCLGSVASKDFYKGNQEESGLGFPTALACMALLDSLEIDLKDKKIAVVGQGDLVGKPVTALLQFRGLKPLTVDKYTYLEDKAKIIRGSDVIISGTGQGKLIKGSMLKEGVILIDAGTSESNNAIVGDVDLESVEGIASHISPVPGGVGPVTVAMLLQNVLTVAKKYDSNK